MEKLSVVLTTRITAAEEMILDLDARLQASAEEKRALLTAAALDPKSLDRLSTCEQKTLAAIADQRSRIVLLGEQVEAALTDEAAARIVEIEAAYHLLALSLAPQQQEWLDGLARLALLFAEAQGGKAQLQLLSDEAAYLQERYATRWAQLPPLALPSRTDVTKAFEEHFRKIGWSVHGSNRWKDQLAEIRKQKNARDHAAAEEQRRTVRSQSVVKMSTPAMR